MGAGPASKEIVDVAKAVEVAFTDLPAVRTIEEATVLTGGIIRDVKLPSDAVMVTRSWSRVESLVGPGKTLLSALASAFPPLSEVIRKFEEALAYLAKDPRRRKRAAAALEAMLLDFAKTRKTVEAALERRAAALYGKLRGDKRAVMEESVKGYLKSLEEMELNLKREIDALKSSVGVALKATAKEQRARMKVTQILLKSRGRVEAAIGWPFQALKRYGDPAELGESLWRRVGRAVKGTNLERVWPLIDIDSLLFHRVMGIVANAKMKGGESWKRMLKAAKFKTMEKAKKFFETSAWESLDGHLNQMRGLAPEAVSAKMGVMEALGHKDALDRAASLSPEFKKAAEELRVVHAKGPFWIEKEPNKFVEFGDGATFLESPKGEFGHLQLLGESKSYLPTSLYKQLFETSDPRFAGVLMHYVDATGKLKSIKMKGPLGGGTPTYVFFHPEGMSFEEERLFQEVVEQMSSSERTVLKVEQPLSRQENEDFVWMLFKTAVEIIEKSPMKAK